MERELVEALKGFQDAVAQGIPMAVGKGLLVFYVAAGASIIIKLFARRGKQ